MKSILLILTLFSTIEGFAQLHGKDSTKTQKFYALPMIGSEPSKLDVVGKVFETSYNNGVIIQNSFPKGGSYTSPTGEIFGYRIFWTRLINENATPIEVTINFSADSIPLPSSPNEFLKLFLPPHNMTFGEVFAYDYGVTNLESFLNTGITKPTSLKQTISPQGEFLFNVVALFNESYAPARAMFVLKGKDLFYKIGGIDPHLDSALIPCGSIVPIE